MSEHENMPAQDETESAESVEDLEVPEEQGGDVAGGNFTKLEVDR